MDEDIDRNRRLFLGTGAAVGAGLLGAQAVAQTAIANGRHAAQPTIFATGGSFFAQPWEKSYLPEYLLRQSPAKTPKVCWLGPASGESANSFTAFQHGLDGYDCSVHHFSIYEPVTLDFTDYLMGMDIVFVGGGSTRNLMALWREWAFDKALQQAWQSGVVMSGGSAGIICWFQSGLTDSFPAVLAPVKATGFLPGSVNPHYHVRPDRQSRFRQFISDGSLESPGLALDNEVGVLYHGTDMVELVSSKPSAGASRLTRTTTGLDEKPLPVRFLGA